MSGGIRQRKHQKMKIGTLTFHNAANYGAVLQTYALIKVLQALGVESEVINYLSPFNEKRFRKKPLRNYLKPRELYNVIFNNSYQKYNNEIFHNFVAEFIPLSDDVYSSQTDLKNVENNYDAIIVGSDQIWNLACTEGDDSFFLPFVKNTSKKNSYAASFGFTEIIPSQREKYASLLHDFNNISVREDEGVTIVRELCGHEAVKVEDPTILLNEKDWGIIADYSKCPLGCEYLLLYLMSEDKDIIRFAQNYARKHSLNIVYITQRFMKRIKKAIYLRDVTPCQWVGLFLKANTIVTNSFHGSAFAVNFKKNMFIKTIPHSIANSRLISLISQYDLKSRLINNVGQVDYEPIESVKISEILEKRRKESLVFLKKVIQQIK